MRGRRLGSGVFGFAFVGVGGCVSVGVGVFLGLSFDLFEVRGGHEDGVDSDEYSAANEARVGNVEVRPGVVANHDEDPVAYGVNRLSELFGGCVPDFNIEIGPAHPV